MYYQAMLKFILFSTACLIIPVHTFTPIERPSTFIHKSIVMHAAMNDPSNEDWRAFRAKLIMDEKKEDSLDPSATTWLYEQPSIERGSLLIHHPLHDRSHYGLTNQRQYLYKSVVLIVELSPRLTVGLVLNRPTTNLALPNEFLNAQIMYGGDDGGIHKEHQSQKLYCLHRFEGTGDDDDELLSGLHMTTLHQVKRMIDCGQVDTKDDFLTFCGYVTLETIDLVEEMDAGEWHCVSVDASTLYDEVLLSQGHDDNQHNMWTRFMNAIGQKVKVTTDTSFDDKMLQEWSRTKLAPPKSNPSITIRIPLERGMVLRASSDAFLLEQQECHKSLFLLLQHDDAFTVGVLLNHPTVESTDDGLGKLPVRYGGHFDMLDTDDEMPPFCLNILGEAVTDSEQIGPFFWKSCVANAEDALYHNSLPPQEVMVVRGMQIWETDGESNPFVKDYRDGKWDIVQAERIPLMWKSLCSQQPLSPTTMETNIDISHHAWLLAGGVDDEIHDHACSFPVELGRDALLVWTESILMKGWS